MTEKTEHGFAMLLLGKLLEAHEIQVTAHEDWFLHGTTLPAIRCLWFRSESGKSGQLDLQVLLAENTVVTESVAGIGEGEAALQDAFYNLSSSSLPVLLAAFFGHIDTEQLSIKQLILSDTPWTAYIGNFGLRAAGAEHPGVPDNLLAEIVNGLDKASLGNDVNWVSCFFCHTGQGQRIASAMLNNDAWPAGEDILKRATWAEDEAYYSARHFIVLKKQADA